MTGNSYLSSLPEKTRQMTHQRLIKKRAINEMKQILEDGENHIKQKIKQILSVNPFPSGLGDIKKIKTSNFLRLRVSN